MHIYHKTANIIMKTHLRRVSPIEKLTIIYYVCFVPLLSLHCPLNIREGSIIHALILLVTEMKELDFPGVYSGKPNLRNLNFLQEMKISEKTGNYKKKLGFFLRVLI